MKKIGIQGWFLAEPRTGIGQHTLGLAKELAKKNRVTIVSPRHMRIPGLKIVDVKPPWWIFPTGLRKWYWERIQAPSALNQMDLDWEYYPYPTPLRKKPTHNKRAMTVHDLILWKDKRYAGNFLKRKYHGLARHSLLYMDKVFTVSQAVHDELNIPNAIILPNGIPPVPKHLKVFIDDNLLVYLGGYDIRKNVPELLDEFANLKKDFPKMRLALIGSPRHRSRYYPDFQLPKGAYLTGAIPDKKVYELLAEAFAFVHFSDAEGFNIPLLQAMELGCPAIVRDIPVNREVSRGTALFLSDSQKHPLIDKIKMLRNTAFSENISRKEMAAAKSFSWKKSAQIFIKTLEK